MPFLAAMKPKRSMNDKVQLKIGSVIETMFFGANDRSLDMLHNWLIVTGNCEL